MGGSRPDLEALANGTPGAFQQSFSSVANKTLDDVVYTADEKQFSQLKNDDQVAVNLVSGVKHSSELFNSRYVKGDFRNLKGILSDLIERRKYILTKTMVIFTNTIYTVERKLISLKCPYCSAVLHSEDARY